MHLFKSFCSASLLEQVLAITLSSMSIISWGIAIFTYRVLLSLQKEAHKLQSLTKNPAGLEQLYTISQNGRSLNCSTLQSFFELWKQCQNKANFVKDSTDLLVQEAATRASAFVPWLATIASSAPFIGLLGTVLGIMESFESIANAQNTQLSVVAPGIAAALAATALGLIAAIPASILYNALCAKTDVFEQNLHRIIFLCQQTLQQKQSNA